MVCWNKSFKEVIVVEGYHDLAKLIEINPSLDVIITNGSEVSRETLEEINQLNLKRGVILFLDPDMQGERIRRLINDYVGPTKHAFLAKDKCISKNHKKVGIEHAEKADIIEALEKTHQSGAQHTISYTVKDLYQIGLIGEQNAKKRRKHLCEHFNIGLSNGKSLCRKLNMFQIEKDALMNVLKEIE
jgi:ribonuclease M5